jgi:short-subunit dehydrogenase
MARRSVEGLRVIITGASSGIGRELALVLAARKCRLTIFARRSDRLNELASQIEIAGGKALVVCGDVTNPADRQRLIEESVKTFGGIDILINNAGIGAIGDFANASAERLQKVLDVNFVSAAELTRLAIPHLRTGQKPIIVNVSSVLGHRAVPMKSEYCASKFALHGWSDAIRAELAPLGIDVLLVSPSTTDSEFFDNVIENTTGTYKKLSAAKSPGFVALKTVKAIEKGKHEIIPSVSGCGFVLLDRLFPRLANYFIARFAVTAEDPNNRTSQASGSNSPPEKTGR